MSQMHFLALFYSSCGILGESLSFHITSLSFKLNSAFSCGSPTLSLQFMSDPAWKLSGKCKYCACETEIPIHMLHCNHNYCSKRLVIFKQWRMCRWGKGT